MSQDSLCITETLDLDTLLCGVVDGTHSFTGAAAASANWRNPRWGCESARYVLGTIPTQGCRACPGVRDAEILASRGVCRRALRRWPAAAGDPGTCLRWQSLLCHAWMYRITGLLTRFSVCWTLLRNCSRLRGRVGLQSKFRAWLPLCERPDGP